VQRFSEHFGIGLTQYQLDFVNIPLGTDTQLFVDPYALGVAPDAWSERCNNLVVSYFELVLAQIRAGREVEGRRLLSRLSEPNETHLGMSRKRPAGRSIGNVGAGLVYDRLAASRAVKSGLLHDLADCELLIPSIGRDKISDITTNIIRTELVRFTQAECRFYRIPMRPVGQTLWDPASQNWLSAFVELPVVQDDRGRDKALILVPKVAVRLDLAYDLDKYYRNHMLEYLMAEHLQAGSGLVHVLKNGKRKVFKDDLKGAYPLTSDFVFKFSMEHEDVFQEYKRTVEDPGYVSHLNLELREPDPQAFDLSAAVEELRAIAPGTDGATAYHRHVRGILSAIFYPGLVNLVVEQEINEGRKRIDILADNVAAGGFFGRLRDRFNIPSAYVPMECKNYSDELGNEELDQLLMRFSERRGKFGILLCRRIEKPALLLKRCKDAVMDNGFFVLAFDDDDIGMMCAAHGAGSLDEFLDRRMRDLLT
jgi:hypothetical protein